MNKVLRGSAVEKASTLTKSPVKKFSNAQKSKFQWCFREKNFNLFSSNKLAQNNNASHLQQQQQKNDSLKRNQAKQIISETPSIAQSSSDHTVYAQIAASSSPKIVAGALIHTSVSKASNFPTPKNSPLRKNPTLSNSNNSNNNNNTNNQENSPTRKIEEKWIDGPRVSKYRVAEARHLMREINHVKKCETWIDGPNINPAQKVSTQNVSQTTHHSANNTSYGYMDSHKRKMIRQWVENQACQIFQQADATPVQYHTYYKSQSQQKNEIAPFNKNDDDRCSIASSTKEEFVNPISAGLAGLPSTGIKCAESSIKTGLIQQNAEHDIDIRSERSFSNLSENRQIGVGSACGGDGEEEDQDSGPSEVPPALPLIDPLSSREVSRHVSRESLAQSIVMMDCALQVTEDDIARAMGWVLKCMEYNVFGLCKFIFSHTVNIHSRH
jgi:kinesin family member 26